MMAKRGRTDPEGGGEAQTKGGIGGGGGGGGIGGGEPLAKSAKRIIISQTEKTKRNDADNCSSSWRREEDRSERQAILFEMVRLIQEKGWHPKLPRFLMSLEEVLYTSADTKAEYLELDTLKERMKIGARLMVKKDGMMKRATAVAQEGRKTPAPPVTTGESLSAAS